MSSIPGFPLALIPPATLPEGYSQAIEGLPPVVEELPDVLRTYILWAEPFDPVNLNLLTWNEAIGAQAKWAKTNHTVTDGQADPSGGTGACLFTRTSPLTSRSVAYGGVFLGDGVTRYAFRVLVKGTLSHHCHIGLYNITQTSWTQPDQTMRKISGPGIPTTDAGLKRISGLQSNVWTEVEISQDAASQDGDNYGLYLYTNSTATMSTGTVTTANGAGTTLISTNASPAFDNTIGNYPQNLPGMTVNNTTTGASSTITTVDSASQITHPALTGGTRQDWQVGDAYEIVDPQVTVYRPQVQVRVQQDGDKWTTPVRKVEELTGPEGAPGETQYVRVSNLGYSSGDASNTIQLSTGDLVSPDHHLYPVALASPYNASIQMFGFDNRLEGEGQIGFGDVEILNPDGIFDDWERWTWTNRPAYVLYGSLLDDFGDFSPIFVGTSETLSAPSPDRFSLSIRDKRFRLNKPLQERVYGGFGSCIRNNLTSSDVIAVGNHPAAFVTQVGNGLTVEARVRMFSAPTQNGRVVTLRGDSGTAQEDNQQFDIYYVAADNKFAGFHEYGAGTNYTAMHQPADNLCDDWETDGQWHHVALVYEVISSTEWRTRWYFDGEEVTYEAGGVTWNPATYGPNGGENGSLYIAARSTGSLEFEGDIDDVRVWDHQRTEEEIASNKDRELRGDEDGLVAYYKLNEQTGTTTYDEVTTQYDTVFRRAWRSDGVDDYAQIPNASTLSPTGASGAKKWTWEVGGVFGAGTAATQYLMLKGSEYWSFITSANALRAAFHDGTGWHYGGVLDTLKPGDRFWLAVTRDDTTDEMKSYTSINGATPTLANTVSDVVNMNSNSSAALDFSSFSGSYPLNGWLYQARIWDRVLSESEIADKFDRALVSADETSLVGNWLFDGTGSDQVVDETTNGNDSTTNTGAWVSTDATFTGAAGDIEWVGSGEGGPELAGKPVPVIMGRRKHCAHRLVDPWDLVYQAGEGPLEACEALYEGGSVLIPPGTDKDDPWSSDFIIESGTDAAAHAGTQLTSATATFKTKNVPVGALVKNTTDGSTGVVTSITSETILVHTQLEGGTENDWDANDNYEILSDYEVSLKLGMVRLRSSPFYPITGDYKGENSGTLGYDAKAAGVVRRLGTTRGDFADPLEIDALAFSVVAANATQEVGEQWFERVNLGSAMSAAMRSIHGTWYVTRAGKLSVLQLVDPADGTQVSATLDENSIRWNELEKPSILDPPWRFDLGWGRYTNLKQSEVAQGAISDAAMSDLAEELRFHTVVNETTRATYLASVPRVVQTMLYDGEDAKAEAELRKALFGVRRRIWRLPLVLGLYQYDLGLFVKFTFDRYEFHSGQRAFVIGWEEDAVTNRIDILVWF